MNREKESAVVSDRIAKAFASLRSGNGVLVIDNAERENEGDLIFTTVAGWPRPASSKEKWLGSKFFAPAVLERKYLRERHFDAADAESRPLYNCSIFPAETLTERQMAMRIRERSGIEEIAEYRMEGECA